MTILHFRITVLLHYWVYKTNGNGYPHPLIRESAVLQMPLEEPADFPQGERKRDLDHQLHREIVFLLLRRHPLYVPPLKKYLKFNPHWPPISRSSFPVTRPTRCLLPTELDEQVGSAAENNVRIVIEYERLRVLSEESRKFLMGRTRD